MSKQKKHKKKSGVGLTKREMQCLMLAMQKTPLLEISKQLNLHPSKVYAHLATVQKKLHK